MFFISYRYIKTYEKLDGHLEKLTEFLEMPLC